MPGRIDGNRSSTIFPLCDLLRDLQSIQQHVPPAFILENTAVQHNFSHPTVRTQDFPVLCALLGQPVCLDAAQFGSYAHRLRNFWSNLASPDHVHAAALYARRAGVRLVDHILEPGRISAPVLYTDRPPFYIVNLQDKPREALPTFCARWESRAFLPGRAGSIYRADDPTQLASPPEPTPAERERAMGYETNTTAAPGASDLLRVQILGRCMDINCLSHLFAVYAALARASDALLYSVLGGGGTVSHADRPLEPEFILSQHLEHEDEMMAAASEAQDLHLHPTCPDIWQDEHCLTLLQTDQIPLNLSQAEHRRVVRRCKAYEWRQGLLLRKFPDGSTRIVPSPQQRRDIITTLHGQTGHFGVRRTHSLLLLSHWWYGMKEEVHEVLSHCALCDRARAAFNARPAKLTPLPIRALFYRWHVDLAGPLETTESGNKYVMICIEAFSKHLELIPLPDKQSATVSLAFLDRVISHFGCPAEVVTDQGTEYAGQFAELLRTCFIDHRVTSPNHPAANGLAERAVQTTKRALRKLVESGKNSWDDMLPWVQLGYNCSVQESTRHSPYQLLFARLPVIPPAVHERFEQPINFDDPDLAAESLLLRAQDAKRAGLIAGDNLHVAQHRDTLRYGTLNSGSYVPSLRTHRPGDFVYLRHRNVSNTLQMAAKPAIYRVKEVRDNGVVTLQGKCGGVMVNNITNLAPCHLPNIDVSLDTRLLRPHASLPCQVCRFADDGDTMLLCDNCNTGWHMACLNPPLSDIPAGIWLCPMCINDGVTVADVKALRSVHPLTSPEGSVQAEIAAEMQAVQHAEAVRDRHSSHAYDGRLICKPARQSARGRSLPAKWGWLEAVPSLKGYYLVKYTDGSTEQLEVHVIEPLLMPEGTQPPVPVTDDAQASASSALVTVHQPTLLRPLDLSTRSGVRQALSELMPGDWSAVPVLPFAGSHPSITCSSVEHDIHPSLLNTIDVSTVSRVAVYAYSTMPELSQAFTALSIPVVHSPEHDLWIKPPGILTPDVIILGSGTYPGASDVTIPLAMRMARTAVCALVPCQYVLSPPSPRAVWLKSLSNEGRVLVSEVPMRECMRRHLVWLVIFASASYKKLMAKKTMQQLTV
jgi:transposase InsO family protein